MTSRRTLSAFFAAALVGSFAMAQTNEDLQKQINDLAQVTKQLKAENADLKAGAQGDQLETEINRLAEASAQASISIAQQQASRSCAL